MMNSKNSYNLLKPIAIIGIDCLFPRSRGLKAYWRLIYRGGDGITDIPPSHWSIQDYFDPDPKKPDHTYCRRGGFIPPIDFDPTEFGIPPNVLEATDTSQLLALLTAKNALADAGYGSDRGFDHSRTSVILGVTGTQELVIPLGARLGFPHWRRAMQNAGIDPVRCEKIINDIAEAYVAWQENSFPGLLGNVVAGRICNRLDLGGTNCVVDAACASSMSALHLALMELSSGRSDMVVSGGVDTLNDIFMHMCFSKTYILSPTGDIRPFAKNADGTVLGEGIGLLVLKRLDDAEKDGDRIYAVIKGLGSASDGKSQSIYAPRVEGQSRAIAMAYGQADIDPASVELLEAHGTGTRVGDRVEFEALQTVFKPTASRAPWCALGSVKSMIGHTKAAAGAAGLIKAAMALHHKVLPPTLKVDKPDPELNLTDSAFYLNTASRPWLSAADHPRRAGVSSFGFGGSNFHAVLEEYTPRKSDIVWNDDVDILAVSAGTYQQLKECIQQVSDDLATCADSDAAAGVLAHTRTAFDANDPYRLLGTIDHSRDPKAAHRAVTSAKAELGSHEPQKRWRRANIIYAGPCRPSPVALVFPGQGSQYPGMGRDFVCRFPTAFQILERTAQNVDPSKRFIEAIYPRASDSVQNPDAELPALTRTDVAQPAIGAISLAMYSVLQHFGVRPDAAAGHSFGELTALCAAGWIDIDAFIRLAVARGKCMADPVKNQQLDPGAMLAVNAPLNRIEKLTDALPVVLANRNSPRQGVLSGPTAAIDQAQKRLRSQGVSSVRLPVAAAFHSEIMEGAHTAFQQAIDQEALAPSPVPVYSNVTAAPYPADPKAAAQLLGQQVVLPVDFEHEIENLYTAGVRTFVEVGPGNVLSKLIGDTLQDPSVEILALDQRSSDVPELSSLAQALCVLAAGGHALQLNKWAPVTERPAQARMQITLTGANYRLPTSPKTKTLEKSPQRSDTRSGRDAPPAPSSAADRTLSNRPIKSTPAASPPFDETVMDKHTPQDKFVPQAFAAIQEGLRAIQKLQYETAEAHKKFLESQTQASRALEAIITNTRRLTEPSVELSVEAQPPSNSGASAGNAQSTPSSHEGIPTNDTGALQPPPAAALETPPLFQPSADPHDDTAETTGSPPQNRQAEPRANAALERGLLHIVSDLTGYPLEMLGLDMDIEADLGIDSIKRVEILSTLEEQMPDLPPVTPEDMGTLKTLGQIITYLLDGQAATRVSQVPHEKLSDTLKEDAPPATTTDRVPTASTSTTPIEHCLLDIVSDLTGYPLEMLGLDMDIEADLGIDSIKRVEILSTLEEQMPDLPPVTPEDMGTLKTLGQIIAYLNPQASKRPSDTSPGTLPSSSSTATAQPETDTGHRKRRMPPPLQPPGPDVQRIRIVPRETPLQKTHRFELAEGRHVYVLDDGRGLSRAIVKALTAQHVSARLLAAEAAKRQAFLSDLGGLVIIPENRFASERQWRPDDAQFLKRAFALTQQAAPALLEAADQGGAVLTTVSCLDGSFGFKTDFNTNPLMGGLAGLVKTAAIEWPTVACRAIDFSSQWQDIEAVGQRVAQEIVYAGVQDPVEIGLDTDARVILATQPDPYPTTSDHHIDLNPGDAVVVTGGARGVTAAALLTLARQSRPTLILMGRSPAPSPEPEWLTDVKETRAFKQAVLTNVFAGALPAPRELERVCQTHLANREINTAIDRLKGAGAQVEYMSLDVRKADQVRTALDAIRQTYGPIRGIIHGAGILADRLIVDKTPEQFNRVFDTKITGLHTLLTATQQDDLKQIILFSSVAARTGNRGQVDYAMANEALNKVAWQETRRRPDCNVVAVNWGPWDGGMVSPSLKKEFRRHDIPLIDLKQGADCLFMEMTANRSRPAEIVVGAMMPATRPEAMPPPSDPLALSFKREIDIETVPVLESHILDGKPVVPLALMTEWFAHGALHANPGLMLHGFDDLRVLKGIRLAGNKKLIRLMAGKAHRNRAIYEVPLELRNGVKDGREVVHSNTKAILGDSPLEPPPFEKPDQLKANGYYRSMSEVYEKILFHGPDLRGIEEIISLSPHGMIARVASAPVPEQWMRNPHRTRWIGDPLALDCAFQMASLWCYEQTGSVSLPSYCAAYRQYAQRFPEGGLTAVLLVTAQTDRKIRADITFVDGDDQVVAQIFGYEAVMDTALIKAFKPQLAASA